MNTKKEKIVGILGGMGPYATVDIFKRILDKTPAKKDWEHLRIIIDNNPKIPSRTRAVILGDKDPLPALISSAKNLEKAGVDFIGIPCNSAHFYYDKIQARVSIPIINMVEETVRYVMKEISDLKKIGLIAGIVPVRTKLYDAYFFPFRVKVIVPEEENQNKICEIIEDIKLNKDCEDMKIKFKEVSDELIAKGAQAIIFGCTEIGILFDENFLAIPIFDSSEILAERIVEIARAGD